MHPNDELSVLENLAKKCENPDLEIDKKIQALIESSEKIEETLNKLAQE